MSTATISTPPEVAPPPITDKTVCVNITFGFFGTTKKVKPSQICERTGELLDDAPVNVDADKTLIRVSKKLLESKELTAIGHHDSEFKRWLRERTLPSMFRGGVHLVKIQAVQQIEDRIKQHGVDREPLVDSFLAVYATCRADAEERLKDLFDSRDYPTVEAVRAKFAFGHQWVAFETPVKLKQISAALFEQERENAAAHWQTVTEEITVLMRTEIQELVAHLADQLEPGADGKRKRLNQSAVENIKDWLERFSLRDVTDDAQLTKVLGEVKMLLAGADVKELRKNEAARDGLRAQFGTIKQQLDLLVEEAGSRKITFEENL